MHISFIASSRLALLSAFVRSVFSPLTSFKQSPSSVAGRRVGSVPFAALVVLAATRMLHAQDTRTVVSPAFPPSCTTLAANLSIVDGEPSSETEFDTTRLQEAMDNCGNGEAVELVSAGVNHAFLIQPITIPNGVTLLVDGGVTVFASRNPEDYQLTGDVEKCGTVGTKGNGCKHLIGNNGNITGSAIMGYGIIDGRGGDKLLVNGQTASYSWWDLGAKAYTTNPYGLQNNPVLIWMDHASNFRLFKITIKNAPFYHFLWIGHATGLTVWEAKLITPYSAANTDGLDLGNNVSDVTIAHSYISNGDDQIAINADAEGWPASNISITDVHTYSGRGVSIGSSTVGGVSNVVVNRLNQAGNAKDVNGNGFRIKSAADRGGLVENITYENVCQRNEWYPFRFDPFYVGTSSTAHIPTFKNITLQNITVLPPTSSTLPSVLWLRGYNGNHPTTVTLNNVVVGGKVLYDPAPEHFHVTLGPAPVAPASLLTLSGSVIYGGAITEEGQSAYPCSAANFVSLVGDVFLSAAGVTNKSSLTVAAGTSVTLNAIVQATSAEYPTPGSAITFYEGSTAVGTAALGGNGTIAKVTLSNITKGTHTYVARYPADADYPATRLGSATVTVQ